MILILSVCRRSDKLSKLTVIPGWVKIKVEELAETPESKKIILYYFYFYFFKSIIYIIFYKFLNFFLRFYNFFTSTIKTIPHPTIN